MALKMWKRKFRDILVFWFLSFLVTEVPDMPLTFSSECPSSRCCLGSEIFAKTGLIVLMYPQF